MAAFPSTPILDTGEGVAQLPMPTSNPWIPAVFSGGYPNCDRDGSGRFSTTDVLGAGSRWPTIFAADMEVYAQIAVLPVGNDQLALWWGHTVLNRGYSWRYSVSGGANLQISSWLGGAPTGLLNPFNVSPALSVGDWIGARRVGDTHYVYLSRGSLPGGWRQVGAIANTATTGAGRIGMEIYNNASQVPTGKFKNFGGGAIQDSQSDVIIGGRGATR